MNFWHLLPYCVPFNELKIDFGILYKFSSLFLILRFRPDQSLVINIYWNIWIHSPLKIITEDFHLYKPILERKISTFLIFSWKFSLKDWNIKAINDRLLLITQLQLFLELESEQHLDALLDAANHQHVPHPVEGAKTLDFDVDTSCVDKCQV